MPDELGELQEHAEHGAEHHGMAPVTMTMAILAVLVAAITLLGHRAHTEEIVKSTEKADQFAYYNAKKNLGQSYDIAANELSQLDVQHTAKSAELEEAWRKKSE